MNELLLLSQQPWEFLGGVTSEYFRPDADREPVFVPRNYEIPLEKVSLADVFASLDETQAGDLEREVVMGVVEMHPDLTSISSPRLIMQEAVAEGIPRLYFQIEGRLGDDPGVATIVFNPNAETPGGEILWESDHGDPEEVGRRDGLGTVSLRDAYNNYTEHARQKLEDMIVMAILLGHPDGEDSRFVTFEGSQQATGIFMGFTKRGEHYIVLQHPALVRGEAALVRAVITFGMDDMDLPIKVDFETKRVMPHI